jgi:phosphoribosylformylglycinamidine synthase
MPWIGTTGGTDLKLGSLATIAVAKLCEAHENWFPSFMAGRA